MQWPSALAIISRNDSDATFSASSLFVNTAKRCSPRDKRCSAHKRPTAAESGKTPGKSSLAGELNQTFTNGRPSRRQQFASFIFARAITPSKGSEFEEAVDRCSSAYSSMIDTQPCSSAYRCVPAKICACRLNGQRRSSFTAIRSGLGMGASVGNTLYVVGNSIFSMSINNRIPVLQLRRSMGKPFEARRWISLFAVCK